MKTRLEEMLIGTRDLRIMHGRPPENYHYSCLEDLILQKGKQYVWTKKPKGIRYKPLKQCYKNAFELACETGWNYCEGFGMYYFPTPHAWVVDPAGNVVDNTWRGEKVKKDLIEYYGIEMPMSFVEKVIYEKGTYGVFHLDDCWVNSNLLKVEWNIKVKEHKHAK